MGSAIFKPILAILLLILSFSSRSVADEHSFLLRYIDAVGKDGSAFLEVDWEEGIIVTNGPTYCDNDEPIATCAKYMRYTYKINPDEKPLTLIKEEETELKRGASEGGHNNVIDFLMDNKDWQFKTFETFNVTEDIEFVAQYRKAHYSRRGRLLAVVKTSGKIIDEIELGTSYFTDVMKSPMLVDGSYYLIIAGTSCGASACGGGTALYKFYP